MNNTTLHPIIFKKFLTSGEYILVDVRTRDEQMKYGIISHDQIHIDISMGGSDKRLLNLDKNTKYLVYCWHGIRSKQVTDFLKNYDFPEVYDLGGGIDAISKNELIFIG